MEAIQVQAVSCLVDGKVENEQKNFAKGCAKCVTRWNASCSFPSLRVTSVVGKDNFGFEKTLEESQPFLRKMEKSKHGP